MKLTIGEVNHYLDQLAGDEANDGKVKVLTQLLQVTTPNHMKWIIQILLRDLKVLPLCSMASERQFSSKGPGRNLMLARCQHPFCAAVQTCRHDAASAM